MDVKALELELKAFLSARQKKQVRYIGLAFSATSQDGLELLKKSLSRLLAPVEIWEGPGLGNAPQVPVTRDEFSHQIFRKKHNDGLLIFLPEEWMIDWAPSDKQVFWTNLAATFGENHVYVVFAGTPINFNHIQQYFQQHYIGEQSFSILTSSYERVV